MRQMWKAAGRMAHAHVLATGSHTTYDCRSHEHFLLCAICARLRGRSGGVRADGQSDNHRLAPFAANLGSDARQQGRWVPCAHTRNRLRSIRSLVKLGYGVPVPALADAHCR